MVSSQGLVVSVFLWALCAASGVVAQLVEAPPVQAKSSRFVRQLDRYTNFVDTGLASASSTKRRGPGRAVDEPRVPYSYFFAATFKNDDSKEITALEWDYVLTDKKDPQREMLRVTVRSETKIAPGKKRGVESRERRGLDHIWPIRKRGTVSVVIKRVEYADGTFWEAGKIVPAEPSPLSPKREQATLPNL